MVGTQFFEKDMMAIEFVKVEEISTLCLISALTGVMIIDFIWHYVVSDVLKLPGNTDCSLK